MFDLLVYVHLTVSAQPYKDVFCLFFVGSRIGTSVYAIHRNEVVWENPDVSQELKANLGCTQFTITRDALFPLFKMGHVIEMTHEID